MPYVGRAPTSTATKIEDFAQDTKIQVEESSDEDTIRFDIAGAEDFTMTANTFTAQAGSTMTTPTLGVGNTKDLGSGLHIKTGDSSSSANANADELVIEASGNGGLSILTPDANSGRLYFGTPSQESGVALEWAHDTPRFLTMMPVSGTTWEVRAGSGSKTHEFIAGAFRGPDGTVSVPGVGFTADTNTGMYRAGTDQLAFTTAGAQAMKIDATGAVTMPLQPAFSIYNSATDSNVTGDGTLVVVDFNTETFDQGSDFATDTFTAPVTGRYLLQAQVGLQGTEDATNTRYTVQLVTSNRPYIFHEQRVMRQNDGGQNIVLLNGSVVADMDASDTAVVKCAVFGGSAVVDIWGNSQHETFFSGCLLA